MLKELLIIILMIGVVFAIYKYVDANKNDNKNNKIEGFCPLPLVEYRYIPRTFEEEAISPVYPSDVFESMFSQPSPWLLSIRNYDRRKQEAVNQFFISQL